MFAPPDTSPTRLEAIDTLDGLRAALTAPEPERLERFRDRVMTPLEPFWKPFAAMLTQHADPADDRDPLITTAAALTFTSPADDVEAALAALDRFAEADSARACLEAVERAVATLDPDGHGYPLGRVLFALVLSEASSMHPGSGLYSGNGAWPGLLMVNAWPTADNLPRLPAAAAHEVHHQIRFRYEPFDPQRITVGQYLVAEGLAEAFAAELFDDTRIGPWATDWDEADVDPLRERYREALDVTGFDEVRGYIFGDWAAERFRYTPQGLPDFAGYAIGYRLVKDFLLRQGVSATEATWLPWEEIVGGSGYLEGGA
jgi:uncharacterized protein YjaZ